MLINSFFDWLKCLFICKLYIYRPTYQFISRSMDRSPAFSTPAKYGPAFSIALFLPERDDVTFGSLNSVCRLSFGL